MRPGLSTHLSEEALDDVLIGLGSPESEAHAASCPECRAKLDAFRSEMWLLNSASMAWSESRVPRKTETRRHGARIRVAFVSWAAVAAALVVMAVALWQHRPLAAPSRANAVESQAVDSEAQIVQDNQLLQAVNAAISPDEVSPIDEYKISERPHLHAKAHPKMRMK